MAKVSRGSEQAMIRLPDGLRDQLKAAAEQNGRSMNAEIIWRIENYQKAQAAWAQVDSELAKLEGEVESQSDEIARLYEERSSLFEMLNNQERLLQLQRETYRTLSILARSLGEAILADGDRSEFARVLASGLAAIEVDNSSEASEKVPRQPWED
ncbi:Arc family DNA-binding protein [Nitratireductor basaltis]|uniref:DNA-binding protein n=1 Tax=Nitratireductor basaltis TaxID=472175 RepID=A0A084UC00_9HYPH|nr:Arc family DNA-binding protein [Nitratireductor basaltis]KFB10486.1 DNA-binding protein [Nitratireductor basaltis]